MSRMKTEVIMQSSPKINIVEEKVQSFLLDGYIRKKKIEKDESRKNKAPNNRAICKETGAFILLRLETTILVKQRPANVAG